MMVTIPMWLLALVVFGSVVFGGIVGVVGFIGAQGLIWNK